MNSDALQAVFFDVDGVLLDSLPQHLRFCADKAHQYGLQGVLIPAVEDFKQMIGRGVVVSPMLNFFLALRFPLSLAKKGVEDYEKEFQHDYRPALFPGISDMLGSLSSAGLTLGVVTSNTRKNVAPALGDAIRYFDPQCLFYFDRSLEQKDKAWCLVEGARLLGVAPSRCLYVGDQPADADAARAAGWQFLGVSYGWGLQLGDTSVRVVESVPAVANLLLAEAPSPLKGYRPAKVKV